MSAKDDWGPEIWPDHYWSEGCCELERGAHPLTPQESDALRAWLETEPGLRAVLASRQARLDRLVELGSPEILLDQMRELIRKTKEKLGEA